MLEVALFSDPSFEQLEVALQHTLYVRTMRLSRFHAPDLSRTRGGCFEEYALFSAYFRRAVSRAACQPQRRATGCAGRADEGRAATRLRQETQAGQRKNRRRLAGQ